MHVATGNLYPVQHFMHKIYHKKPSDIAWSPRGLIQLVMCMHACSYIMHAHALMCYIMLAHAVPYKLLLRIYSYTII